MSQNSYIGIADLCIPIAMKGSESLRKSYGIGKVVKLWFASSLQENY